MLRQSSRKKDVKDICYSRFHLFLFVGFLVDGPKKKENKNTAKYKQVVWGEAPVVNATVLSGVNRKPTPARAVTGESNSCITVPLPEPNPPKKKNNII